MSRLRVALVLLGDAMLCIALVMIVQIDQLVHGTLYSFGLVFSDSWAQPYWLMVRLTLVLIGAAMLLITMGVTIPSFPGENGEERTRLTS
jgi:hypothetical protein